jgi:hypothetical protein
MQRKTESQKLPLPECASAFFAWFTENIPHEQPQNLLSLAYGQVYFLKVEGGEAT